MQLQYQSINCRSACFGQPAAPRALQPCGAIRNRKQPFSVTAASSGLKNDVYVPPSRSTGASELVALNRLSVVVPDTLLMKEIKSLENPKAATVSCNVLSGLLQSPASMMEYKLAVERALSFDQCSVETGNERTACYMDKALANIGALFAGQVEGRVSTEVDPRIAYDTDGIVARSKHLIDLYQELGVPASKVLMRIPATWEGIQAAGQLEAQGIATHVVLLYSFVQGAAAAQAGVSVIQPNVGRISDWFSRHPGYIRDPQGPREDSGYASTTNPGVKLVEKMYNYCKQYYPKTQVMAAGLRSKQDALDLAGCDYLVISPKVLSSLASSGTLEGYNDGLHIDGVDIEGVSQQLSAAAAQAVEFSKQDTEKVTKDKFKKELGLAGTELLDQGVRFLVEDAERLESSLGHIAVGSE